MTAESLTTSDMVRMLRNVPLNQYNALKAELLARAREDGNEQAAREAFAAVDHSHTGG